MALPLTISMGLSSRFSPQARQAIQAAGTELRFAAGQTIHQEGDKNKSLMIVLDGEVGLSRLDAEGREVALGVLGPGGSFGEISLLTGCSRTHYTVAKTQVRVLKISERRFHDLLDRNAAFRNHVLAVLAGQLHDALNLIDRDRRQALPQRVAGFLLDRAIGGTVPVKQADIAASVSATREAVAVVLKQFREAGLIETRYRAVRLIDPDGLRDGPGAGMGSI